MPGLNSNSSKHVDEKEIYTPATLEDTVDKQEDVPIHTHRVHLRDVDEAAKLVAGFHGEVTEEQSLRVRRKVDRHMLPLM